MENKKDIGKAIREKLDHLDKSPNENLWDAIYADLQKKKKRRLIFIPFWIKVSGIAVAAAIVLLMAFDFGKDFRKDDLQKKLEKERVVSGNGAFGKATGNGETNRDIRKENDSKHNTDNQPSNANTTVLNPVADGNLADDKLKKPNSNEKNNGAIVSKISNFKKAGKNALALNRKKKIGKGRNGKSAIDRLKKSNAADIASGEDHLTGNTSINGVAQNPDNASKPDSIQTKPSDQINLTKTDSLKIADKKKILKKKSEDSLPPAIPVAQRISIFVYAGPAFGRYISKKSPLDKRLNANKTATEAELSYGALLSYAASDKWRFRFGLGITNLRFVTKDAEVNTTNYANIDYTKNISNQDIYGQAGFSDSMDIIQDISYTEIPLELNYIISKRKIGFNAFGGLSYMFLSKNNVSVRTANGSRFDIGETENLGSNTFTVNVGAGLDYKFAKKISFNVEPVFSYHLIDYKSGGARPYSMAVRAGFLFSLK